MKKILLEKGLAFFIVFIAFLVAGVLYNQGKISFLPKDKSVELQNVVAELPYTGKEFRLSCVGDKDNYLSVSDFEESENWGGDANFDYSDRIEGESALTLGSQNNYHAVATSTTKSSFSLSAYRDLKLFVNLRTEPQNLDEINLTLYNASGDGFHFPLRALVQGWNLIKMDTGQFTADKVGSDDTIVKLKLELVSRPKSAVSASFDSLWAEKNDRYLADWNTNNQESLGWKGTADSFGVMVNKTLTTVKEIASAKDYTAITRITPMRNGSFGVFNRGDYKSGVGYYFLLGGAETSSWQLYKYGKFKSGDLERVVLTKGEISNVTIEKNKPYWFKAELMGNRLTYSLSLDGLNFSTVAEANDNSFGSGGIGVSTNTIILVDGFEFSQ